MRCTSAAGGVGLVAVFGPGPDFGPVAAVFHSRSRPHTRHTAAAGACPPICPAGRSSHRSPGRSPGRIRSRNSAGRTDRRSPRAARIAAGRVAGVSGRGAVGIAVAVAVAGVSGRDIVGTWRRNQVP